MSLITTIRVVNFMSIADATVTFDESNILNIKGYNDSGKSAILRAVEVTFLNKYQMKQSKFIQDGKDFFRVIVSFDDGVQIVREKYRTGPSLYEMYVDGDIKFSTRAGETMSKVDDVPETIAQYLNLTTSNSVHLNSRLNTDVQLLVETTGSDNFAAINEILRTNEISRAVAMANSDRNKITATLKDIEVAVRMDEGRLLDLRGADKSLVRELDRRDKKLQLVERRHEVLSRASEAFRGATRLDGLVSVAVPTVAGVSRLTALTRLASVLGEANGVRVAPGAVGVPTARLAALVAVRGALSSAVSVSGADAPPVARIETARTRMLADLSNDIRGVNFHQKEADDYATKAQALHDEVHRMVQEQGLEAYECTHCGQVNAVALAGVGN